MAAGEMGRQLGVRAERAEMLIGYRKEKNLDMILGARDSGGNLTSVATRIGQSE